MWLFGCKWDNVCSNVTKCVRKMFCNKNSFLIQDLIFCLFFYKFNFFCGYGYALSSSTICFHILEASKINVWIYRALIHYVFSGRPSYPTRLPFLPSMHAYWITDNFEISCEKFIIFLEFSKKINILHKK